MTMQAQTGTLIGIDDLPFYALAGQLIARAGTALTIPAEDAARLTGDQIRLLTEGLEWMLAGEAASDAFLRFLSGGPRGRLDVPDADQLPAEEVAAVRDRGVGAATLPTLLAACTTAEHFVELLSAADLAPWWEERRRTLFEEVVRRSSPTGPPSVTECGAIRSTDETLADGGGPPGALAQNRSGADLVALAVERCMYRILTGPDAAAVQRGLVAWDSDARHTLARRAKEELWGSAKLTDAGRRKYYREAAAVLRTLLLAWVRAQTESLTLKATPLIELANEYSLVFPLMDGPPECDWVAASDLYESTAAADPTVAEMFALHLYTGISYRWIAALTGREEAEVRFICKPLIDKLAAGSRAPVR